MVKAKTWAAYKKEHGIVEEVNISKILLESGFIKLDMAKKKSTDPRLPAQIVAEAIDGTDYEEVVYFDNQSWGTRGSMISIWAKLKSQ